MWPHQHLDFRLLPSSCLNYLVCSHLSQHHRNICLSAHFLLNTDNRLISNNCLLETVILGDTQCLKLISMWSYHTYNKFPLSIIIHSKNFQSIRFCWRPRWPWKLYSSSFPSSLSSPTNLRIPQVQNPFSIVSRSREPAGCKGKIIWP